MWKDLLTGLKDIEAVSKSWAASVKALNPSMTFMGKMKSLGSKSDRMELQKMREIDRKYLVLQPYFEIVNRHFAMNNTLKGGPAKNKKAQKRNAGWYKVDQTKKDKSMTGS